jgi:polar amino acid transport system permease protein
LPASSGTSTKRTSLIPSLKGLDRFPWWLAIVVVAGVLVLYSILAAPYWNAAFAFVQAGLLYTIVISVVAFAISLVFGLLTGLGQLSKNVVFRNLSMLYVQVVRGVPLLVQVIFWAFVIVPAIVGVLNGLGNTLVNIGLGTLGRGLATLQIREIDMTYRAVAALAVAFGAFEAEIFRAGIESIERGQMEAARSLGMTHFQAMRYIVLPQAIRVVLPPLGNDFIAILKDSSLISVLAVRELTHLGQLQRARTFRSWESLGTVAFLYLALTLSLSALVRWIERRMAVER